MKGFLSSYRTSPRGSTIIVEGLLCPIPNRCKKCRLYISGQCTKKKGVGECKRGYSVFNDDNSKCLFFGARVLGYHNPKFATVKACPVCLTKEQFLELINYDLQKINENQILNIATTFSATYDNIVRQLKSLLPKYRDAQIVSMPGKDLSSFYHEVNGLDTLMKDTEKMITKQVPYNLFPTWDKIGDSIFPPEQICLRCKTRECNKGQTTLDFSCRMCANGCSYCSFQHRVFYGLRVIGFYKKAMCKSSLSKKKIPKYERGKAFTLVSTIVKQNDYFFSLQRFLHDVRQYLFGLSNMLPIQQTNQLNVQLSVSDIRSIAAFLSAMKSLQREFLKEIFPAHKRDIRSFEPFPLFYKYRYCFECKDVKITVVDTDEKGQDSSSHEIVEGPSGFEFVILNIFSNSIKYLPKDHKRMGVIDVQMGKQSEGLVIVIKSLGPKVTEDELCVLGQRGFRGAAVKEQGIRGQGYGLNRVVSYINEANYKIAFESKGKTYTIGKVDYREFLIRITIPTMFCRGRNGKNPNVDSSFDSAFDVLES